MKVAILIMAMIISLLVILVILFKYEADFWKKVAEKKEKYRYEMYKHCVEQNENWANFCDKMNKDWSNSYYTLKEYCNKLETLLNLNDESEVEK